ncbi:MAG TPA: hypothetical protein VI855_07135, partial [Dehalococcoidia bacterium]|nr:hypothetical protein [Dehalococcoidia bacterium]
MSKITRVLVEVLETPVKLRYVAAGHAVESNWHVLARIDTDDGIQGLGFVVANRGGLVKPLAQASQELG